VVATLSAADAASDSTTQRLAAVYIRRDTQGALAGRTQPAPAVSNPKPNSQSNPPALTHGELLGQITPVVPEPSEKCFSPRANCMEVQFDLAAPGYVLVFRSGSGALHLSSCKAPVRTSGVKRYRFKASDTAKGDSSIYAVATLNRKLAVELHNEFSRAAINCSSISAGRSGRRSGVRTEAWLSTLDDMVSRAPGRIYWQAFYSSPEILAQAVNLNAQEFRR